MNTATLSLSSNNTNFNTTVPLLSIVDITKLELNLFQVSEKFLPLYLQLDWGDGNNIFVENDMFSPKTLINNTFSSFFYQNFTNIYYPNADSKTRQLTAVCTLKYCNNDVSTFIIPITITNYNYNESIEDMYLLNTVLETDKKIHQFVTKKDGLLIEVETPFN
jgi:hypothetical protein